MRTRSKYASATAVSTVDDGRLWHGLEGRRLVQVHVVLDALHLYLGDVVSEAYRLECYVWPGISGGGEAWTRRDRGYHDALVGRIEDRVKAVDLQEGQAFSMEFESGFRLSFSLQVADQTGPEAVLLHTPDGWTYR